MCYRSRISLCSERRLKTHTTLQLRLWLSYCSTERHYRSADTLTAAEQETALPSAAPWNHALCQPCTKPKFNSYFIGASCQCLNGQSPPSNHERPRSIPWDVRRAKWKRRMIFSQHLGFSTANYHPNRSGSRKCRISPAPTLLQQIFHWKCSHGILK